MFIVWIFIVMCQFVIIPRCSYLTITLVVTTVIISAGCVLVMAEEYPILPKFLRSSSATLVHDRSRRTIFVCGAVILMSAASSIGLIMCYYDGHLANNYNPPDTAASATRTTEVTLSTAFDNETITTLAGEFLSDVLDSKSHMNFHYHTCKPLFSLHLQQ
jgi:hypothetical protein